MALINVMEVDNGKVIAAGGTGGGEGGKDYVPGYNIDITGETIKSKDFVGTQDEWDALTAAQKAKFDQINITDDFDEPSEHPGHAILNGSGTLMPQRSNLKASGFTVTDDSVGDATVITEIPYTAGRGIEIDNKEVAVDGKIKTTFTGTKADWAALDDDVKAQYEIVNLTDDIAGGNQTVVDVAESGNMNPITSNAVYDLVHTDVTLASAPDRINLKSYKGTTLTNGYKVQHDGYVRLWFDSSVASSNLKVTVGLSSVVNVQLYHDYTGEPSFNSYSNHVLFIRKGLYVFYNCNSAVDALDTSKWVIEFCPLFDVD